MENYAKNITKLLGNFLNHKQNDNSEKDWMINHLTNSQLQAKLNKLQTQDVHILTILVKSEKEYNIKQLPAKIGISQPSISRAINRLTKYELIKKYHPKDNSKEYVIALTNDGRSIAAVHQKMQNKLIHDMQKRLEDFSNQELQTFIKIFKRITN